MFINSGSTLLNLALTGHEDNGWKLGAVSNIIGDRSSGKTLLAIEAATLFINNPPKDLTPKVFYYEAEAAFDQAYAASLGMPIDQIEFREGETVEALFESLQEICKSAKKGEGILVILDSLDALTSLADIKKDFGKQDYDRKAAKVSELFRKMIRPMQAANVHLMIISQIRENISAMPFAPKWRRSGGKALDFYATHIIWLQEIAKLKNEKTTFVYGIDVEVKITKNKVSSPFRNVKFPVIFGYGVDNIDSMLKFLTNEKLPKDLRIEKATGGFYILDEQRLRLNDMVEYIDDNPKIYRLLVDGCREAWDWLEAATTVKRRNKSDLISASEKAQVKSKKPASVKSKKPASE